jgi:hypothetical protein|tara:strand:+ start:24 stop:323 length:300 start_codon:yes stop_codon:yes gene_type:complete
MSIRDRYVFLTTEKEDQTCVGIKGGKFAGVVLKYSDVTIAEQEDENGNMPFKFKFDILDNNGLSRPQFENEEWTKLIGDILVDIIDRQYEGENKLESNN